MEVPPPARSAEKISARVVPHAPTRGARVAARLIWALASAFSATLRWRFDDRSGLFAPGNHQPAVFCLWHNRQTLGPMFYHRYVRRRFPDRSMVALASASRDGALAARVLELFGLTPVRGSSSRRGLQALGELLEWAGRGLDLAVTPDGPRGPRYVVQMGVITTAQLTGLPIVPISYRLSFKKTLKTWDRFQVPLPFSRCDVIVGEPLSVPRRIDDDSREQLRAELERRMRAITFDS